MATGLLPALSLLAGIAWSLSPLGVDPRIGVVLPAVVAGAAWSWRRRAHRQVTTWLALGFLVAGASLGADARNRALQPTLRDVLDREFGGFAIESPGPAGPHDPVPTRMRLLEDASVRDGYVSLRARATAIALRDGWVQVDGGVQVSVTGDHVDRALEWRAGRALEAPVTFRRPARYWNEGVPDFERDRAYAGVALLGSVKSGWLVQVESLGGAVGEVGAEVRAHVRRAVTTWIAPHDPVTAAIASAVLIGDRTGLPDQTREALQAAGTYHVIAISGGNIAILAAASTGLLLLLGIRGRRAAVAAIGVLAAFAVVVTGGPSVWRATCMAVLFFAARAVDHRSRAWQTAAMAMTLMVIGRPLDVVDPGFVLSFGATIALLEGGRVGLAWLPRHSAWSWLAGSVAASLAVEVALLPISAWLFSRVTAAGLALNVVAVPLMGVVQIAALLTTVTSWLPTVASLTGWIAHLAALALVRSADLVSLAPWSSARVPPPSLVLVATYYGALLVCVSVRRRVLRLATGCTVLLAALAIAGAGDRLVAARPAQGPLRLTVFDVGQAEAVLLDTPAGSRVLIDAGGVPYGTSGFDVGTRVLVPALWAREVRRLDAFLFTHADPDHLGGGRAVLDALRPGRVFEGIRVPAHDLTRDLVDAAARRRVPVQTLRAGQHVDLGGVRVRVLHPPAPDWERRAVRNDDSVVLEVVYGDVAILLTGDAGAAVERAIVPLLTPARVRVLKVAHHGSRTSSSAFLLETWRPQVALISCGRGNSFGHPAPEVLTRLAAVSAAVYRTDVDGQITVESDGTGVAVRTILTPSMTRAWHAPIRRPSPRGSPPPATGPGP